MKERKRELDVITISRRQARLRSQKGAKIIFLSGVALYGCVFTLEGFVKNARLLSTENSLDGNCREKRRGEAIVLPIPREKEPANLMLDSYCRKFARVLYRHPWRNRGEKFATFPLASPARRSVEKYKWGRKIGGILSSRYARKECQNICITSSDDRLFRFAQHLFEFTTRFQPHIRVFIR